MSTKPTDVRILEVRCESERFAYRTPMKFGGRVVNDVLLFHVAVEVETLGGRRGRGYGSMPMGNVWAWPSATTPGDKTLEAMIEFARRVVEDASGYGDHGHPIDICHDLATGHGRLAAEVASAVGTEPMPRLAMLVAASPLEAAIYDAFGKALRANVYDLLSAEFVGRDLSAYLNEDFQGEYLDQYTLRQPKSSMPLYHLVGALDPLTEGDIPRRLRDGLPETLGEWIAADGLTHLKIKLNGDDLDWDVERVVGVDRVAVEVQSRRGCGDWCYSADFNEKCTNVQYVLDFLSKIEERSPAALRRLQYIEQPTHRDLRAYPENKMHAAAKIKPIVIDESLVDFETLLLSREQGYSGVALKACKGHTEALLMGAAAQRYKMFLCVQDLTCPGASFLHSASLAARIPTVAAIEGNGRQYCPAANSAWADAYPTMFQVQQGQLDTSVLSEHGLGFSWPSDQEF